MLNKVILMGRLTADPELKHTQSGTAVASFTVAVERNIKNADGSRSTDFIRCVAWQQRAEFIKKYFAKGRMICVVGSIQTRSYTDQDGNKRTAVEVLADEFNFTGEPRAEAQRDTAPAPNYGQTGFADVWPDDGEDDDDIPF